MAGAGLGWILHTTRPEPRTVTRWAIPGPEGTAFPAVSLSRDGTRLAYTEGTLSASHICLRMMDQLEGKPIPGADGSRASFSPDGQWIVFTAPPSKVKKIPVTGGTPITLCEGTTSLGASWGDDDTIVLTASQSPGGGGTRTGGLIRVSAGGGKPQVLTTPDAKRGEVSHRWPRFLPGAQALLFTIGSGAGYGSAQIALLDLKTGAQRVLAPAGSDARYVPAGHLVFAREGRRLPITCSCAVRCSATDPAAAWTPRIASPPCCPETRSTIRAHTAFD